jgi:hypothetical protein
MQLGRDELALEYRKMFRDEKKLIKRRVSYGG